MQEIETRDARKPKAAQADIFGAIIPFVGFCDIVALEAGEGRTRLQVRVEPHHCNQMGVAHGGLLMTLLDVCMGTATRTVMNCNVVTIDMQTAFLAPARGLLTGRGKVARAGKSIAFVEGEIVDESGEVVCKGTAVFKAAARREADKA